MTDKRAFFCCLYMLLTLTVMWHGPNLTVNVSVPYRNLLKTPQRHDFFARHPHVTGFSLMMCSLPVFLAISVLPSETTLTFRDDSRPWQTVAAARNAL